MVGAHRNRGGPGRHGRRIAGAQPARAAADTARIFHELEAVMKKLAAILILLVAFIATWPFVQQAPDPCRQISPTVTECDPAIARSHYALAGAGLDPASLMRPAHKLAVMAALLVAGTLIARRRTMRRAAQP
jgi:hypothetical protein